MGIFSTIGKVLSAPGRALNSAYEDSLYGPNWQERAQYEQQQLDDQAQMRRSQIDDERSQKILQRLNVLKQAGALAQQSAYDSAQQTEVPGAEGQNAAMNPPRPQVGWDVSVPKGTLDAVRGFATPDELASIEASASGSVKKIKMKEQLDEARAMDLHNASLQSLRSAGIRDRGTNANADLAEARAAKLEAGGGGAQNYNDQLTYINGQPVMVSPRIDPSTGKYRMTPLTQGYVQGAGGPPTPAGTAVEVSKTPPKPAEGERRATVAGLFQDLEQAKQIVLRNPDAVGFGTPTQVYAQSRLPGVFGQADPDKVQVQSLITNTTAQKSHDIFGSRLTETEQAILGRFLPNPSTDAKTFLQQLDNYQREVLRLAKVHNLSPAELGMDAAGGQGQGQAPGGGGGSGPGAPQVGQRRTFKNGAIGVWDGHGWKREQ